MSAIKIYSVFKQVMLQLMGISLLLCSTVILANDAKGIRVTGKATIEQQPDLFYVTFSLNQRGYVAEKLKNQVDHQAKQLTNAARKLGIKSADITSTQLQIYPIYRRDNNASIVVNQPTGKVNQSGSESKAFVALNNQNKHKRNIEFNVSREVEIKLADVTHYEKLLTTATKIGVTRISPVRTGIKNANALYQRALEQALANAKQKAQMLANSMAVKLGKVSYIEEVSHRAPSQMMRAVAAAPMVSENYESFTGLDAISAEVITIFSIQPE